MQIVWYPRAEKQWQKAMDYCEERFGMRAADRFQEKVLHLNTLLATNPYLGPVEEQLNRKASGPSPFVYRSVVVNPTYKLIYRVDEPAECLYIIALWDCRINPVRLYDEVGNDWPLSMVNEERMPYGKEHE